MTIPVLNALTIDVEDYFMVSAFESFVPKAEWSRYESRVDRSTRHILGILAETNVKATFFVVGWIAQRFPDLVRTIRNQGHEVASHGHFHRMIYNQTQQEFQDDLRRSKHALEAVLNEPIHGYRAPSFSLTPDTEWAFQVLREEGFLYDASVLPAPHARGGFQGAQRYPHHRNGIAEFPMSTIKIGGRSLPFSGGGYFRLFPYRLIRTGIRRCNDESQPAIVYLHSWEFDPSQPRMTKARFIDRWRHYVNLNRTERKFRFLLRDFRFGTVRDVLTKNSLHTFPSQTIVTPAEAGVQS